MNNQSSGGEAPQTRMTPAEKLALSQKMQRDGKVIVSRVDGTCCSPAAFANSGEFNEFRDDENGLKRRRSIW